MAVPRVPARRRAVGGLRAALLCVLLTACAGGPAGDRAGGTPERATPTAAPATSTGPAPTPADQVDDALAALDERARVSQLFVIGVPFDDLGGGDALARSGVGGLFMAGRSQAPARELATVTAGWQELAPGPALWIAVDQEGGAVQALKGDGFPPLPTAQEQGRLPGDELTDLAAGLGASLEAAGVNLDLAPVVDVVPPGTEAGNAPIGSYGRQYGGTPEQVTAAAGTIVEGLADAGVTATLKHFPGLGRVAGNTDVAAVVHDTGTTREDPQLTVFSTLADSPAEPFVMASSAIYDQIDPSTQAMFSPVVLTDVLREQLGFDGVVISDDLGNAEAVSDVPVGDRAVRFLAAGGTLVLTLQPADLEPMVEAVLERAGEDPGFAALVEDAVRTALLAKARAGLLDG